MYRVNESNIGRKLIPVTEKVPPEKKIIAQYNIIDSKLSQNLKHYIKVNKL